MALPPRRPGQPPEEGVPVNPIANVPGQPQNPEPPQAGAPGQGLPPTAGQPGYSPPSGDEVDHELPDIPEGEIDQSLPGEEGEVDNTLPGGGLTKWQIAAALVHLKRVLGRQAQRRRDRRERRQTRRATRRGERPNIVVIMGDDIGIHNLSCYNHGIQDFYTPNIDRIATEGCMFTDSYGQNSCTAGRSAFIMGQSPFRLGLTTVGLPGSPLGIPDWAPTVAQLLKDYNYRTGQFGKNHLGDMNAHLPTVHGFDEFFGSLYHLNAQEEPETEFYPKDPAFLAKYGPRGVVDCKAGRDRSGIRPGGRPVADDPRFGPVGDQTIVDTGPLDRERMKDHDDGEIIPRSLEFIRQAAKDNEPFFCWINPSRCHVWTRMKDESKGKSGVGVGGDGVLEHDAGVGKILDELDKLKISDNTIVLYTTDNGAEAMTWPDGGSTPFHGEKGTTWEGGFRVPMLVRWPGVIEPLTVSHEIIALEDWLPTFLAAVGEPDIVGKLKAGHTTKDGKSWKVHPDGFNFLPYFLGETDKGPREEFIYFSGAGELNAIRWNEWKVSFASVAGNLVTGLRNVTAYPIITHLRADPYEVMHFESGMYFRWYCDNAWIFIPIGEKIAAFMGSLGDYPKQFGSSAGPQDINFTTAQIADAVKRFASPHMMVLGPLE